MTHVGRTVTNDTLIRNGVGVTLDSNRRILAHKRLQPLFRNV